MKYLLSLLPILTFAKDAHAQSLQQLYKPATDLGGKSLAEFIQPIITNITLIAGIAAFFTAIFAGFRYVASAGDAKQTQNATNMLTYSLIGLGISVLAFWITRILFEVGGAGGLF